MSSRRKRADAIRALAMDAVERAKSGHPGAPMGLADFAEVLWRDILRHNPSNPEWWDRDRVTLSNGHASMLMYAVLHLTGYQVSTADLKSFRQLHAPTAGHPEYGECPGIETTTGPLGQGFANAVGMALAESMLAREFNRPGHPLVDHRTWAIVGDGCLMEGISHEAASLAGTLGLGKLTVIYDDNGVSIDGFISEWFTEDVPARFEAYGWEVIRDLDGHDADAVLQSLRTALKPRSCPMLICMRTTIGYGAPNKGGTASTHGSPLGEEEVAAVRRELNWHHPPFEVPAEIRDSWDQRNRGLELERSWEKLWNAYQIEFPDLAEEFRRRQSGDLPLRWAEELDRLALGCQSSRDSIATRQASGHCLDVLGPMLPELIGGSADLTGSNNTKWKSAKAVGEGGRYLSYGVREFAMTAMSNGMLLHGGFRPFTGTFLVFMEYARNAVRLAALMGIPNIFVYTHDSVALGEDGPTHQPIEQLTNLRTTPNLSVWRPCDSVETALAWKHALLRRSGPTALVLTRQKLPVLERTDAALRDIDRGGYVIHEPEDLIRAIVLATGSEVDVALKAASILRASGTAIRVVSIPSVDTFLAQDVDYQRQVLPDEVRARVAVEAAHPDYWRRFVGLDGEVVGISRYGASAPGAEAMKAMGIHAEAVVEAVGRLIG